MSTPDRKTIGVTRAGAAVLAQICGGRPFQTELDAARFATSLAIAKADWPQSRIETETKWNVGSFDPKGDLKSILEMIKGPVDEPYRVIEALLDRGLQELASHLQVHGALDLEALLPCPAQPSSVS